MPEVLGALNASNRLKENVSVFVMLKDGISGGDFRCGKAAVGDEPRDPGSEIHCERPGGGRFPGLCSGSDLVEFLQTNPLPDSYEVKLDGRSAETGALSALEKQVMSWDGVDEVGVPAERDRAGYVQHQ